MMNVYDLTIRRTIDSGQLKNISTFIDIFLYRLTFSDVFSHKFHVIGITTSGG